MIVNETDNLYEEYEEKCEEIREKNITYLEEFQEDLLEANLVSKTIRKHLNNVNFYINTYLLQEEALEMLNGTNPYFIDDFLGNIFIRKCMWSSPQTIKETAASIKKFYKSMLKRGHIEKSDYQDLIETIKDNKETWIAYCEEFDDLDAPNPFRPY